jgi:hypothetical protein
MHDAHALYRSFGFIPSGTYAGREFAGVSGVDEIAVFVTLDLGTN